MNTKRKIMIFDVVLCNNLEEDNAVKYPWEYSLIRFVNNQGFLRAFSSKLLTKH